MMPSAQKQQTTVSQNGAVTTTTTVTTAAPTTTTFTQQELGTRSMARQVERQIDRMNQEKSQAPHEFRGSIVDRDISSEAEDFAFSSTTDIDKVPERVRSILEDNDVDFNAIMRIIHIPGARYFSISESTKDGKKYSTYSLDDYKPPVVEVEEEEPETPVEDPDDNPENWNEQFFDIPVEAVEKEFETRAKNLNALGTIGVLSTPSTSEPAAQQPGATAVPVEPVVAPTPVETVKLRIQELETPKPETPLELAEKKLTVARLASARENDAYYANKYSSSTLGTLNDLFGNNQQIHSELFKTIAEYATAKQEALKEIKLEKWKLGQIVDWLKNEQIEKARLFSHQKYGVFIKIASLFHLKVPSVVETRTGSFAMTTAAKSQSVTERLGIQHIDKTPHEFMWQYLFSSTPQQSAAVLDSKPIAPVTLPVEPTKEVIATEIVPQKIIERSAVFHKLYPIVKDAFGIGKQKVAPTVVMPPLTEIVQSEPIVMKPVEQEPVIIQPAQTPIEIVPSKVQPISISPVTQVSQSQKQHPENLFA